KPEDAVLSDFVVTFPDPTGGRTSDRVVRRLLWILGKASYGIAECHDVLPAQGFLFELANSKRTYSACWWFVCGHPPTIKPPDLLGDEESFSPRERGLHDAAVGHSGAGPHVLLRFG